MKIEIKAFPRKGQGTGASRRLRTSGRVPGVLYGGGKDVQAIELDHNALSRHLKMEAFHASILEMTVEGAQQQVLLRDFQMHPWKVQQVLHVDFQRVAKDRKIHMKVPLHFINAEISPGVKLGAGVVSHVMNEIEVSCLPDDLPEFIQVDLANLQLGHPMHAADLQLPDGLSLLPRLKLDNPVVATVQVPRALAVEEVEGAPVTEIIGEKPGEGAEAGADKKDSDKKEPEKKEAGKKEAGKKEGGK
jgi:large subunit ribosomal protein L25